MTRPEAILVLQRMLVQLQAALDRPSKRDDVAFVSRDRLQRWATELRDALGALK